MEKIKNILHGVGPVKRAFLILFLLGALLRFPWLTFPKTVVFDEVHFGKFVTAYCCSHERFFDIHPPHAKLLVGFFSRFAGYPGGFDFEKIGKEYPNASIPYALRFVPAVSGTLLPLFIFWLVLLLGASLPAAFLCGLAFVLDNATWVQTRIIALDGVLLCSIVASIAFLLKAQTHARMVQRVPWLLLCGAALGMAIGTKFTGLTAGAVVFFLLLSEWLGRRNRDTFFIVVRQTIWIGFGFFFIYLLGWKIHFALTYLPGHGDAFVKPTGSFFFDLVALHKTMLSANYNLTAPHPDASPWWSWPLMRTPVYYWTGNKSNVIYFFGNPAVWWGMSFLFIVGNALMVLSRFTEIQLPKMSSPLRFWVPLVGFSFAFLPNARIPRALFLYHFLPPLCFVVAWMGLWMDRIGWTYPQKSIQQQRVSYFVAMALLVLGFILAFPMTSGVAIGVAYRQWLFKLFPLWP